MAMLPGGMGREALKAAKQADPKRIKHVEAIVLSMTAAERANPDLIDGSRRARIAKGSGRTVQEVNRLLKQFEEMGKFMKGGLKGVKGMMPPAGRLGNKGAF